MGEAKAEERNKVGARGELKSDLIWRKKKLLKKRYWKNYDQTGFKRGMQSRSPE